MVTKRDTIRIIFVLLFAGIVYPAAGYLFDNAISDFRAFEEVPATPALISITKAKTTPTQGSAPAITEFPPSTSPVTDSVGAARTFTITVDQTVDVTWYINGNPVQSHESVDTAGYTNTSAVQGTWIVKAAVINDNGTASKEWTWVVTAPRPAITESSPESPVNDIEGAARSFKIWVNQTVTVNWSMNGKPLQTNWSVTEAEYTNASAVPGRWIISATAANNNGTASKEWTWVVTPPRPAITNFAPEPSISDIEGAARTFNITVNQTVTVYWFLNGTPVQTNQSVTEAGYTNTRAVPGRWIINATAVNDNGTASREWTWEVKDVTPPGNVSNLTAAEGGIGQTYIDWTWTDPVDADFRQAMVLLDGVFRTNVTRGVQHYNATDLAPATSHTITVAAVDASDNIASQPWPENTSTTLPNTLPGNNVVPVGLPPGVNIRFDHVTDKGNTTVSFTQVSPVIPGFYLLGNYMDISTSASFTGTVTITLNYPPPPAGFNNDTIRLYRLNNTAWEDIPASVDSANNIVTCEVTNLSLFAVGINPPPRIQVIQEPASLDITVRDSLFFHIMMDQAANVTWKTNGIKQAPTLIQAGGRSNFTFSSTTKGNYSVAVEANNTNGTDSKVWNVIVHPKFFFRGNRIWDGSRPDEFSLTYTWNPMSFSGFYYDMNDDVGDESITIALDSYDDRTINSGKLVYTTSPQEVRFGYSGFGSYEVIGFMAEKFFAGYTAGSRPPNPTAGIRAASVLGQGQLHKVLIDDDTRRTVTLGGTLTLQEGYVLKAQDIDMNARIMLISLLKDGNEVDVTPLSAGQTYVYTKKVGAVSDLPILMVRFDSVFSGREVQAAFLKGIFQTSESYDTVTTGNRFDEMEVRSVNRDKIEMRNDAEISLSRGTTVDLMGDVRILVADSTAVRFALSVRKTGSFEVRSSVYRDNDPIDEWTPYSFGMNIGKTSVGFYYDLDSGIGTESLRFITPLGASRTIHDGNLLYTTSPQEVSFGYSGFGSYGVIGFMAEKYFAGYTAGSRPPNPTASIRAASVLAQGQLHKVLIDDDTQRTVTLGGTLTLQEGYVLKAEDIDMNARIMLISLLKDGNEVDVIPLSAGQTYVYTKKVGAVSDLPLLMVRFDSVFSGREVQAAFLKGIFQISEGYASVRPGNRFGMMEVRRVGGDEIEMTNDGSISLDRGRTDELMGDIKLKVGDTTDDALRFYFAVDVTAEMVANQLIIEAPDQATAGDAIDIKVRAGGVLIAGASLMIDTSDIGQTDAKGTLTYTLPRTMKGVHKMTASKLGYEDAITRINVLEYIERRLSMDAPATANQFETITIRVTYSGTPLSGAAVRYDNTTIGSTNSNGTLNYTLETSGTHSLEASKSGYITVVREINVRAPFSDYRALDINITPDVVFTGEDAVIRSNITNVGTKADTLPVELIMNTTAVDNRSVTLAPGEIKEVNFTRKEEKAGNYTVEILGQKGLLQVKERPFVWSLILIVLMATGLGALAVYLLTAQNKITLETIRRKLKAWGKLERDKGAGYRGGK